MTELVEGFAAATSGYITPGNTSFDSVAANKATFALDPIDSLHSMKCPASTLAYAGWGASAGTPITAGKAFLRCEFMTRTSTLNAWKAILTAQDQQGAYLNNGFTANGTGAIRLASLTGAAGSFSPAVDTWYRLELDIDYDAKQVAGRIFVGPSSTATVFSQTATWGTVARTNPNGQADALNLVSDTNSDDVYFRNFAYSDTAQPGPIGGTYACTAGSFPLPVESRSIVQLTATSTGTAPSAWEWAQTAGPSVALSDATAREPAFTAPATVAGGVCAFSVRCGDGTTWATPAATEVTVLPHIDWVASGADWQPSAPATLG